MFIEKLTEEDFFELFSYLMKEIYKKNHFIKREQVKSDAKVWEDQIKNIGTKEKSFVLDGFTIAGEGDSKRVYLYGTNYSRSNTTNLVCSHFASNIFTIKDFNIKESYTPNNFEKVNGASLNKAYLKFMYKKFGEEYKKAYVDYSVKRIGEMAKETQNIADEMSK